MIQRQVPIEQLTPDDGGHYWVGYYDKQPWSADGSILLAHRSDFCDRFPNSGEQCDVGYIRDRQYVSVAKTNAWNWQQGAHLRWHSLSGGDEMLLYNDFDESGHPVSRWIDRDGNLQHEIGHHLYSVSPRGDVGLTLSFGRLTRLRREYGYPALTDQSPDVPAPDDDGIWRVDLQTGERELLVSMAQLAGMGSGEIDLHASDAPHQHVNHIMITPDGKRCCFLHRFDRDDGILQSRLCTIGLDGSSPRVLMQGMVSHYDWLNDDEIVAWGGERKLLGEGGTGSGFSPMRTARKMLKPIYYAMGKPRILMNKIMGDSYLLIPDREDSKAVAFAKGELTCDGHNTFQRGENARWMVTDGYPDMKSRQPLYLWDFKDDRGIEIGRFETPRAFDGEIRVDLHPRFSPNYDAICIDSAMSGSRAIYSVDISSLTGCTSSGHEHSQRDTRLAEEHA